MDTENESVSAEEAAEQVASAEAEAAAQDAKDAEVEDGSLEAQIARLEAQKEELVEAGKKAETDSEVSSPEAEPEKGREEDSEEDLRGKYEALKREMDELRTLHERESLVRDNGLPKEYASFIGGDKESWQGKVDMLLALRGKAVETPVVSVPRDPAVDAELSTANDNLATARSFFGLDD